MRKIKSFLVICTACILVCSIPLSASAVSPFDEDLAYYTYGIEDESDYVSTSTSPWYDVQFSGGQICGRVHCRGGHVDKAFLLFIPFMGYYLVVKQENDMRTDFTLNNGRHAFYHVYNYGGQVVQSYFSYEGAGYLSSSNRTCFQDVFFGSYYVFMMIANVNNPDPSIRSSLGNFVTPSPSEEEAIKQKINDNRGTDKPFPSGGGDVQIVGGSTTPTYTYPNGTPVPTNSNGEPLPTDIFGNPVSTLPNGMESPTYPDGRPVVTYRDSQGNVHVVPWDSDNNKPLQTILYNGDTYVINNYEQAVTDPDTGEVLPDPEDPSKPWIEQVTIYNDENGKSEINSEFSNIYSLINDIDDFSSLAESNQEVLSSHISSAGNLISSITSFLPSPIIACLVCGAIMIIAVKITGSGKS